jgi:RNA-directed DNA polymerase
MPAEGRGLGSVSTQEVARDGRLGNPATPFNVQKLQAALHAKSKSSDCYRFYPLYDKIHRQDILAHAWAQCRSNRGAAGVDRQDFADIEAYGVEQWLSELSLSLRKETYRPDPIRRVLIPKPNGKLIPIPTHNVTLNRVFFRLAALHSS